MRSHWWTRTLLGNRSCCPLSSDTVLSSAFMVQFCVFFLRLSPSNHRSLGRTWNCRGKASVSLFLIEQHVLTWQESFSAYFSCRKWSIMPLSMLRWRHIIFSVAVGCEKSPAYFSFENLGIVSKLCGTSILQDVNKFLNSHNWKTIFFLDKLYRSTTYNTLLLEIPITWP